MKILRTPEFFYFFNAISKFFLYLFCEKSKPVDKKKKFKYVSSKVDKFSENEKYIIVTQTTKNYLKIC